MLKGFRQFLLRGNVIDLAVAVVIGTAFGTVVTALVADLITPLIAALVGKPDFSAIAFQVNSSKFLIGDFINALLSFIILAAVIYYLVVVPVGRVMDRVSPPAAAVTRECPFCLSKIPLKARRCAFCSSDIEDKVDAAITQLTQPKV